MKMNELLQIPIFTNAKLVAGKNGVGRSVQTVNIIDTPDIIHFLKPNELLVTTAYFIRDNPTEMVKLVKYMAKNDCSGLGIKTRRFIQTIPSEVINIANEENLPLIELPIEHSLGKIVNESLSHILKKRAKELQFAINTQREFTKLVHKGEKLPKIIDHLSTILEKPILLIDHLNNVLVKTHHFHSNEMKKLLENIVKDLEENHTLMKHQPHCFSIYNPTSLKGKLVHFFSIDTYFKKSYLIIIGFGFPIDEHTLLSVEQVANVISFDLLKQHALSEKNLHFKNNFFTALLDGDIPEVEIVKRGERYGLNQNHLYNVIACKIDEKNENQVQSFTFYNSFQEEIFKFTIYEQLKAKFSKRLIDISIFIMKDVFVLLISVDKEKKQTDFQLTKLIRSIQKELHEQLNLSISFGVSSNFRNIRSIKKGYQQALEAIETGYQLRKNKFIQTYHTKDIAELLQMIPLNILTEFYESTLKELAYTTNKDLLVLVQTISVFIENHCQIAETAKQLFVHRNTVIYRLEKCEELLTISFKDADETLRLRIALLIRSFLLEKIKP
ncbi:PucR family transcriptional regulator [Metabacillus litoralis]|uniref:PucR family transcriptional regulator n=1 Tax=Metabacillus litoralis TaxID=152268 RepID=UPI00203D8035|nr:PucR family transcriptional regulator [Metabacillus litoralis]MCM3651905.1 PucR family transcriptional regulator ligand-binding domain-containing protein [Metabacillus litoralis]